MNARDVRNWLGKYFVAITFALAGIIYLFGGKLLHLDDSMGVLQIILPVFLGQLSIIFSFFTNPVNPERDPNIQIPSWVVKWPPMFVIFLLVLTILLKVIGFELDWKWVPSDIDFKRIVTFCVTILNATTIYIISRYFG